MSPELLMNSPWMGSEWVLNKSGLCPEWVLSGSSISPKQVLNESWLTPDWIINDSWLSHDWVMIESWLVPEWVLQECWNELWTTPSLRGKQDLRVTLNWAFVSALCRSKMGENGAEFRRQRSRALWRTTSRPSEPPTSSLAASHNELPGRRRRR